MSPSLSRLVRDDRMPIVNGRYEARISTTYATPEEGLDAIV